MLMVLLKVIIVLSLHMELLAQEKLFQFLVILK
jgi:hypothetical protein